MDYTKIFHTVPLSSKQLSRNIDGTKTNPGFPDNWIQYQSKQNTNNTPLLGAIAREDFIGIDIDNSPLFKEALEHDNDTAEYVAESDLKGGHLLYTFNKEDYQALKDISKDAKKANIDIQIDNKLIYLATEANKTKTLLTDPLTSLPTKRIPKAVINLIYTHTYKYLLANPHLSINNTCLAGYDTSIMNNSTLGYLLESENYQESIIDSVIPKKLDSRHPKDVKQGEGTDWMNSVRFKLAQDPSVSESNFKSFMLYLNSLWEDPMPESRVLNDCNYDIKTRLNSITGDVLWTYNDEWKQEGYTYPNRHGNMMEVMFDSTQALFIEHDRTNDSVAVFQTQTEIINRILSYSRDRQKTKGELILKKADSVILVNTPEELRGKTQLQNKDIIFNQFKPSEGVQIINGSINVKNPQHPTTVIKFLENLIIDDANRLRLMQFLAYKHRTYEHSELYFVFAGVGGAGKGLFTSLILPYFAGHSRMQDADLEKLSNSFNIWMGETDYVVLDEVGEGDSKREQEKLVGMLKNITGKATFSPSRKGKDIIGENKRHYMTPVVTTNMNTKLITDTSKNDRRLVLFRCPNKLTKITDDTREFVDKIKYELPHFANYIKTLPPITNSEYRDNGKWKNRDYEEYIKITISPIDKIVEAIEEKNLSAIMEVFTEDLSISKHDLDSMFKASKLGEEGRLLIYNTTATQDLGMRSLVDISESLPELDSIEIKTKLRKLKNKVSHLVNGKVYNLQVVQIPGNYKPMGNVDSIEEIEV